MFPPSRIVCLTEETVETLYLLGEQDRIVGISGYVVRLPQARRGKPRVRALKPDLVLTFSDLQAGIDIFAERRHQGAAKDRVVTAEEVITLEPDLIIGSWCGKKFQPERVVVRLGFGEIPAVQHQDLYEIKSSLILQPGPAALTDGL